jgi:hypothetical protein
VDLDRGAVGGGGLLVYKLFYKPEHANVRTLENATKTNIVSECDGKKAEDMSHISGRPWEHVQADRTILRQELLNWTQQGGVNCIPRVNMRTASDR